MDDRFQLVAGVLSSDPDRATRSAEVLGIDGQRSYDSFYDMAIEERKRADGIDVVAIVTPNHLHYPVARTFLEQGFSVICEKPLALNLDEALNLQKVVAESSGLFSVTYNYSGYPLVRHGRQLIQDGQLGKIRVIQVEYAQDWLTKKVEALGNKQAKWRSDPDLSGHAGCVADIGTHAFHLACFMTGLRALEVASDLSIFVPGRPVTDNAHMMLRFEKGARGMLWASQVAPGNENALKIRAYGEKGGIEWSQENPNQMWFTRYGEPTKRLTRGSRSKKPVQT
jgi:predicted dehydrogenase